MTYLTGMNHEFNYDEMNEELKIMQIKENLIVECAYDTLKVPISLV